MDYNTFFEDFDNAIKSEEDSYTKNLSNFIGDIGYRFKVFDEVKKQADRHLASDFNVFDFIQPNENRISDIIAMFLRPNGRHGQGSLFGKLFLESMSKKFLNIRPSFYSWEDPLIYREHITTGNRRIDILIRFGRDFAIGIENKPWASDGEEQIYDYVDELEKKFNGNFIFIYLSGDGKDPDNESINKKELVKLKNKHKFACLDYSCNGILMEWLKACREKCEAEKVRTFIKDFIDYIEKKFKGNIR